MGLVVNTNVKSLNAQRNLTVNNNKLGKSIERLSSGLRINNSSDDAAGLSIATKLAAQVKGIDQAIRNSNNAISLVQVAEGGINTITNILFRLRELSVQAASGDNTKVDRQMLTGEADNLIAEVTRIASTLEFNTQTLLDGTLKNSQVQIGANSDQTVALNIGDLRAKSIGSRAEFKGNIADGVNGAVNEGFSSGEIKVNGTDVAATNEADDQFSVFTLASGQIANGDKKLSGTVTLNINGTTVNVAITSTLTGAQIATSLVGAINDANITNITARTLDTSGYVIEAKAGINLTLAVSGTNDINTKEEIGSTIGLDATVSANFDLIGTGTVTNNNGESSSIAKAVAINAVRSTTTVNATSVQNITTATSAVAAATISAGDVFINGIDIGAVTIAAKDATATLVNAINDKTGDTAVTASLDNAGKLVLTSSDGRNITIQAKDTSTATNIGLASGDLKNGTAIFRGTVRLNSAENFTLTATGGNTIQDLDGTTSTNTSVAKNLDTFNISKVKIDTIDNATAAIMTIDAALDNVNALRADMGAIQNRIEFTISNLEIASENTSASESRIRDADFAREVAIFTKNQILVQAGAAMLSQANTLPQIALQLLQA